MQEHDEESRDIFISIIVGFLQLNPENGCCSYLMPLGGAVEEWEIAFSRALLYT